MFHISAVAFDVPVALKTVIKMVFMVWSSRVAVEHAAYHTISVTRGRQRLFDEPANALIVVNAIRHASQTGRAFVLAYAVMPDHLHLLVVPRGDETVSTLLQSIKRFSAKQVNERLKQRGSIWQQSFYDRLIRGDRHLERTMAYIEWNPVSAGFVQEPHQYPFSSASPEGFQDAEAFWSE